MGTNITKDQVCAEFEDLKRNLDQGGICKVAAEYQKRLIERNNLPLHIAVTGQTGAGKSSLINAIRGVCDEEEEAAKIGVVEESTEPKAYPHPSFPNIQIWDLPGIGITKFQAVEYLKKVKFETYDVFIIVASDRFTKNDAFLAKEIKKMEKRLYFVRSKIDASIQSEERKKNFNKEKTLETIRKYCQDNLKSSSEPPARVFLISSRKVREYDFPLLQETITNELPDDKKDVLIRAMHIFSEKELMMKKEQMKSYIKDVALISCACGAVPVPGFSTVCDIAILIDTLKYFCRMFNLDDRSLRFLEQQTGKEFEELRSAIKKTPLANEINKRFVLSLLGKSSAKLVVKQVLNFIPAIGSVVGAVSSYSVTYQLLNSFLDDTVEDARNVREKHLE